MHDSLNATTLLGLMAVMLGAAKLLANLAARLGQPAVLGELLAGVLVGKSVLGLVDPSQEVFQAFGEIGVVILLFSIGLETDIGQLLRAGPAASAVAIVGVILPFVLGYGVCWLMGMSSLVSVVVGAASTATSVGITARVLSDLGRLQDPEGQVILGAAILDDVIGLVILTVVGVLTAGGTLSVSGIGGIAATAFGFLGGTFLAGRWLVPRLSRWAAMGDLPGTPAMLAIILAFGLGWLADQAGSAAILGAFAAGVLVVGTPRFHDIEVGVTRLGHFFVPLFFVTVGAAVDVTALNPLDSSNHRTLLLTLLLTGVATAGKFASGYAPVWFRGNKRLIGAGMIPRGEVGLIFAQVGMDGGVLDRGLFAAVAVMVLFTTLISPPLLKALSPRRGPTAAPRHYEGIEDLSTEA